MNWKLTFQLSAFGLIMAFATVSLIPEHIEFVFWLGIFIFCAYVIAKVCRRQYFLNGFMVSIINGIWIVAAHVAFYSSFVAHHVDTVKVTLGIPPDMPMHPRLKMVIDGPFFAIGFGLILGLFSFIASKIVTKNPATT